MTWFGGQLAEAWRIRQADKLFPIPAAGAEFAVAVPKISAEEAFDRVARHAVTIAVREIGHGEIGGNNRGQWVKTYCGREGVNWCAGFAGWCYEQAAIDCGVPLPFKRSLGAKKLGQNVGKVGRIFTDPTKAKPGDLVVWHRGAAGSWAGHVGILERTHDRTTITVIEGNSGPTVRLRHHDLAMERFAFFASVRV